MNISCWEQKYSQSAEAGFAYFNLRQIDRRDGAVHLKGKKLCAFGSAAFHTPLCLALRISFYFLNENNYEIYKMISAALPKNEKERIRKLNELCVLDTLEEQAYDDLTQLAAQICGTPIALVTLVDNDRQWFKSHHGLDVRETPRDVAFCAHAILGDSVFVVEDSSKDERFYDNPLATDKPNVKFYAGAPLVMNHNLRLGTLCVINNQPQTISDAQKTALVVLARQVVSQLELRLKIKELKSLDNAKDEFISMVSHELKTPLTSITGSLSLLSNNKMGQLDSKQLNIVKIAARNSDRLLCIVNDILDSARLEAGKLDIVRKTHSPITILEKAVELNKSYCAKYNCDIVLTYNELDIDSLIECDESRLLQVLSNLISNAAEASYDQGIIEVSIMTNSGSAHIEVTDHGSGIPEDQQEFIFQKFKQIGMSNNQKMPGTGLGLWISKHIVELHDGTIGFESVPKHHTKFYFTLKLINYSVK